MKHTPGPWFVDDDGDICVSDPNSPMGREMVADAFQMDDEPNDVREANARLIAAAPELLEACHTVAGFLSKLENCDTSDPLWTLRVRIHKPLWDKLRPAIAKAEGRDA